MSEQWSRLSFVATQYPPVPISARTAESALLTRYPDGSALLCHHVHCPLFQLPLLSPAARYWL